MYCGRGIVYCNLWDYQAAIQDYNQALKINPNYVAAHYNRSLVYLFLGNYKEATEDYNKAITQINPNLNYELLGVGNLW